MTSFSEEDKRRKKVKRPTFINKGDRHDGYGPLQAADFVLAVGIQCRVQGAGGDGIGGTHQRMHRAQDVDRQDIPDAKHQDGHKNARIKDDAQTDFFGIGKGDGLVHGHDHRTQAITCRNDAADQTPLVGKQFDRVTDRTDVGEAGAGADADTVEQGEHRQVGGETGQEHVFASLSRARAVSNSPDQVSDFHIR